MRKRFTAVILGLALASGCATGGSNARSSHAMTPGMVAVLALTIGAIVVAAKASESESCTIPQCASTDLPTGRPPER